MALAQICVTIDGMELRPFYDRLYRVDPGMSSEARKQGQILHNPTEGHQSIYEPDDADDPDYSDNGEEEHSSDDEMEDVLLVDGAGRKVMRNWIKRWVTAT